MKKLLLISLALSRTLCAQEEVLANAPLFSVGNVELYRNNLKNWEFGKEVPQNFCPERAIIAERQGASENKNSKEKPTLPKTNSSGCFGITAAVLYWNAHQDGMEFAIRNFIEVPVVNPTPQEIGQLNNLINDDLEKPKSKWEFGFQLGLNYLTACDGWGLNALWTHFSAASLTHVEAELGKGQTLIALWSGFSSAQGGVNFARDIEAKWKLDLNLADLEMGRAFWVGKCLSLRPFWGLRYALINQDYKLEHKGGSWSPRTNPPQDPFTGNVALTNDYKGLGLRSGLETLWHINSSWSLYNTLSGSLIYGRFQLTHCEKNQLVISPYTKSHILDTRERFRASRAILDLNMGVQWSQLFCNHMIRVKFGFNQLLFFHQNQLWRIVRVGDTASGNVGENVFLPCRGTLDTQGWILALDFIF